MSKLYTALTRFKRAERAYKKRYCIFCSGSRGCLWSNDPFSVNSYIEVTCQEIYPGARYNLLCHLCDTIQDKRQPILAELIHSRANLYGVMMALGMTVKASETFMHASYMYSVMEETDD